MTKVCAQSLRLYLFVPTHCYLEDKNFGKAPEKASLVIRGTGLSELLVLNIKLA